MNTAAAAIAAVFVLGAISRAHAQNCAALPPASDFMSEVIAQTPGWAYDIAVDQDLKVYWVERQGAFRVWDPGTKQTTLIKQFSVLSQNGTSGIFGDVETGLQGLLLDPDFAATHWIYVWYSVPASKLPALSPHALIPLERLSRFTLKSNHTQVDDASEKIIFEHKVFAQCCHYGGAMKWGPGGALYLSTGDNIHYNYTGGDGANQAYDDANAYGDPRNTSSNTDDTRGKILRIKPIPFPDAQTPAPGIGSTYEIPAGNLRSAWSSPDSAKVRREIFSMGHRNPFTISVHPVKGWVAVGEANGDHPTYGEDEINVATGPGYFGWPFLIGKNLAYIPPFWSGKTDPSTTPNAIVNDSRFNTGARVLPPAIPALVSTKSTSPNFANMQCFGAVWGWVNFDPASPSASKWPAYFDGKLLVSSYGSADLKVATLDNAGKLATLENLFSGQAFTTDVMRAVQGPDGAFYVSRGDGIQFGTSAVARIYKIGYKGACNSVPVKPGRDYVARRLLERPRVVHLGVTKIALPPGVGRVRAYGSDGRLVWETVRPGGVGAYSAQIPGGVASGFLQLRYFEN